MVQQMNKIGRNSVILYKTSTLCPSAPLANAQLQYLEIH